MGDECLGIGCWVSGVGFFAFWFSGFLVFCFVFSFLRASLRALGGGAAFVVEQVVIEGGLNLTWVEFACDGDHRAVCRITAMKIGKGLLLSHLAQLNFIRLNGSLELMTERIIGGGEAVGFAFTA